MSQCITLRQKTFAHNMDLCVQGLRDKREPHTPQHQLTLGKKKLNLNVSNTSEKTLKLSTQFPFEALQTHPQKLSNMGEIMHPN